MTHIAKRLATLTAALGLCLAVASVSGMPCFGAADAQAWHDPFNNGTINNGGRVVGSYSYLYGVGWEKPLDVAHVGGTDNVCVGAKTRSDGSGGNAIPFLCVGVAPGEARWTPGGQSNYGYPTAIANADPDGYIFGIGWANRR